MNLQTVITNLRNTIAGKEKALEAYRKAREICTRDEDHALFATIRFLDINIDELKKILADVEACVAKDVEQSWRDNPDRSGGQFTDEEINRWCTTGRM